MLEPVRHFGRARRALGSVVLLAIVLAAQRAPAQRGDLSFTPQIWLQEVADTSFKHAQCRYDFQAFRQATLDLLNKEPFTFFALPGIVPLVDVPWLRVAMTVSDNSSQCTVSVDYMICDKKIVVLPTADGTETHCPDVQRYFSMTMNSVSPARVQTELGNMTAEMAQSLAEKWRAANPR